MDDAQFGIIKILRPYTGYETAYQGQPITTVYPGYRIVPIMFTEGGNALDAEAGKPGYSPTLVRGLSVPLGSRIQVWLPLIVANVPNANPLLPGTEWNYKWLIAWRLRNVFDFRSQRKAYHYPKQIAGVPNSNFAPPADARVVLPAAMNSTLYVQPRPEVFAATNNFGPTAINQADVIMVDKTNGIILPLLPGVVPGQIEQGLVDPASGSSGPSYLTHECQAEGDELLIGVYREEASSYGPALTASTWDFAASKADSRLSTFLAGSPDIGVYVTSGKAT